MKNFTINQGDSYYLTVIHVDEDGETEIPFESGDRIIFSARKKLNQKKYDIQSKPASLVDGEFIIQLTPEDTNVALGEYYYDIQLITASEDVYTILKGMLTIEWDVTD